MDFAGHLDIPDYGPLTLKPRPVSTQSTDLTWPLLGKAESSFACRARADGHLEADGEVTYMNGIGRVAMSAALDD